MRKLIINADDFGASSEINDAVICHPGVTGERKQELDFLIDPKTKKLIIQEQIKLISWAYFLKQK